MGSLSVDDTRLTGLCVVEHVSCRGASLDILIDRRICIRTEKTAVVVSYVMIRRVLLLVLRSITAAIFTLATLLVEEREVVWVLAFLAALAVSIVAACEAFSVLLAQH